MSPAVFVVLDDDLGNRSTYKLWEEAKPPDFALEVISPSCEVRNQADKRTLYVRLGIREYPLFQPGPKRPGRRLVGYRLWSGVYVEIQPGSGSEPRGALRSETLGVSLRPEGAAPTAESGNQPGLFVA